MFNEFFLPKLTDKFIQSKTEILSLKKRSIRHSGDLWEVLCFIWRLTDSEAESLLSLWKKYSDVAFYYKNLYWLGWGAEILYCLSPSSDVIQRAGSCIYLQPCEFPMDWEEFLQDFACASLYSLFFLTCWGSIFTLWSTINSKCSPAERLQSKLLPMFLCSGFVCG